jgi:hypothetical protein
VNVVSNPEFLAEGTAVRDCLEPDRIVVGAGNRAVAESVAALYGPAAIHLSVLMDLPSAELVKYASNACLATRLTFVNSIAARWRDEGHPLALAPFWTGWTARVCFSRRVSYRCGGVTADALVGLGHQCSHSPSRPALGRLNGCRKSFSFVLGTGDS